MSAEIVPISEIKKRKSASEAYRDAYEIPNPHENKGISRRLRKIQRAEITPEFDVIDFQAEPTTTALAKIPSQKMSTVKKSVQKMPSQQNVNTPSKVSPREISVTKPRSEKSRRNYKKMFNDVVNIQDASFTEEFGEEEKPAVSAISAPKMKSLAAGKKQEPAAKTKSQLAKVEKSPQFVSEGCRAETSVVKSAKKARKVNDRWLIDAAADELYHTVNVVGKAAGKAVKEGFKATRTGIKAINTITGDIIENPAMKNIAKQHETTLQGMANNARRVRGSILATGNTSRKRLMTAGSLITTHTSRTNTGTTATVPKQRVFTHVVHRKGGDIIRYFDSRGLEISATQAKRLIKDEPLINVNDEPYNQNVRSVVNPIETTQKNPFGTRRKQGNPIGEITRAATASGLIRRAKNPVGVIHGAVQSAYKPTGAVNTATTATTATNVMKNPTGFVHRNPVVNSIAETPSRLLYRYAGA